MQKDIKETDKGVTISFSGDVQKSSIIKMVENCKTGQCGCMSEESKSKIEDMEVDGKDGKVELNLKGTISKEEVQTAMKNSKIV